MPRAAFNTLWAEDPTQFETPSNGQIEVGWEGGADKDPPSAGYQNWWQNRVDTILQEIERQGAPSWVSDAVYAIGAVVYHSGAFRVSRTNNNTGNNPSSSGANWRSLGNSLGYVPPGGAILWYGSVAEVPDGWRICDGTNGTPDMRDRVAVGAGGLYSLGQAGGGNTATSSTAGTHAHTALTAGAHAHSITVNNHTLTIAQIPPHQHDSSWGSDMGVPSPHGIAVPGPRYGTGDADTNNAGWLTGPAGGGQGHNHGASSASAGDHAHVTDTAGAHNHAVDVRQPYRAWHYIMRVA